MAAGGWGAWRKTVNQSAFEEHLPGGGIDCLSSHFPVPLPVHSIAIVNWVLWVSFSALVLQREGDSGRYLAVQILRVKGECTGCFELSIYPSVYPSVSQVGRWRLLS